MLRAVEQKYSEDAKLETYYVPKALQTVRVTCVDSIVGYGAFMNFVDLAYVSLQEGDIKKDTFRIEDYAFYNCTSLRVIPQRMDLLFQQIQIILVLMHSMKMMH